MQEGVSVKMTLEYHEPRELLPASVIDQHRAISSLVEELEAITWYHQRAAASGNSELKAVMEHNRDEEIEHASMLLEWMRRNFPGFDEKLKTYLFTSAALTELEQAAEQSGDKPHPAAELSNSLNIGSMRKGA